MKQLTLEIEAAAVEYNGYIYFCEPKVNGLFRTNLKNSKTEFLCLLSNKKVTEPFRNAYRYKNYAWFIPWEQDEILCINLDNYTSEYFSASFLKENKKGREIYPNAMFHTSGRINDEEIFLVPTGTDTPIVINMKTKEIKAYKGIVNVNEEIIWYGVSVGYNIWMVPYEGKRVIILNYKTGEVEELPWEYDSMQYSSMLYHDNKIWFAPNHADNMLVLDLKTKKYDKIPLGQYYKPEYSYLEIKYYDEKIWILPWWSKLILFYDLNAKQWSSIAKNPEICTFYDTELRAIEYEDKLALVTCRTGYISLYDALTKSFKNIAVRINKEEISKKIKNSVRDTGIIENTYTYENYYDIDRFIELNTFLQILVRKDKGKKHIGESNNIGKKIWNITKV